MTYRSGNGNPLSAGSLAVFMAASLPKDQEPQLKSPYDAIALAVHAAMIAVGFRLVGLGEDDRIEAHSEATATQPLPSQWNASSSYAFRYAHDQSSMEYVVKVNRLGSKAVVMGLGIGDDKTATFDVLARDYISESNLPATPLKEDGSMDDATKTIQDVFISAGRLADLASLFRLSIIQKLAPGLHKPGYEETDQQAATSSENSNRREPLPGREPERPQYDPLRDRQDPQPARPYPFNDPLAVPRPPRGPYPDFAPPGFEDEHQMNRPPRGRFPGRSPLNIGEEDLYPAGLGPHDPLRPNFGPGLRPGGMGGGMHPTFDDPLFRGGPGGDDGFDMQAPPGARYDPVGPGGTPRDQRGGMGGRFPGGGGFGGRPPNPFGGFGGNDFI